MDYVRIVAYGFGGLVIGGILGLGIISIIPFDAALNLFYIIPGVGILIGFIAGVWLGSRMTVVQGTVPGSPTTSGLRQNITGWSLAVFIAIGVIVALIS